MAFASLLLSAMLALGQDAKPAPPPLTEQQIKQIQELVRTTQADADRLKALLEAKQRELARHYAEFELDEKAVARLETEILDVQRQMLGNYHKMQVALRTLVGKERFLVLKQRLDRIVGPPGAEKDKR